MPGTSDHPSRKSALDSRHYGLKARCSPSSRAANHGKICPDRILIRWERAHCLVVGEILGDPHVLKSSARLPAAEFFLLILDAITGQEMKAKAYDPAALVQGELIRKEASAHLGHYCKFPSPDARPSQCPVWFILSNNCRPAWPLAVLPKTRYSAAMPSSCPPCEEPRCLNN